MRTLVLLSACVALSLAVLVPRKLSSDVYYADKVFLQKQKFILDVLDNVHQPLQNPEYLKDVAHYVVGPTYYNNYAPIQEFINMYERGVLPQNYVYSILDEQLLKETICLFNLFYYAKDWTVFYKNVVWARQNMNEGMFVYALSTAVVHRKDMEGIILPALPEIEPYMFFTGEVMSAAGNVKLADLANNNYLYSILANYTDAYEKINDEYKLAYLTEDIGWNTYNYYFHINYPFWMEGKEFGLDKDRRGELYLYVHQQILARYYLERLSQNLGPIPQFTWQVPIKTGYNPHLRYYNGFEFASRKNLYDVAENGGYDSVSLVQDYERRIRDIIDMGYYTLKTGERINMRDPQSVEVLGNIIQGNPDSVDKQFVDYMTLLAKVLLGGNSYKMTNDYKIQPSVLEHFETAMRDPVFYQLYSRVIYYYSQFKDYLQPYTYEDLLLPGVAIQNVQVTPLITYYDYYGSDITNGVNIPELAPRNLEITPSISSLKKIVAPSSQQPSYTIVAKQKRLNHKPFIVNIDVVSQAPQPVIVRIYYGPKLDAYRNLVTLKENRDNYVQIDQFYYDLPGGNVSIKRLSKDFNWSVKDRTTYTELYQKVMTAYSGASPYVLDQSEAHCGLPDRLLLPKGWIEGMPLQVYVIITPYNAEVAAKQFTTYDYTKYCAYGKQILDNLPYGYPFDRAINELAFTTPNMYFKDVVVYHAPKDLMSNMNMAEGWIPYQFIPAGVQQYITMNSVKK